MDDSERHKQVDVLCTALWEMAEQCGHDLVGEHREFYCPRITEAFAAVTELYPRMMVGVITKSV